MKSRDGKAGGPAALDLFAGAGGLGLGLEAAGFRVVAANEREEAFAKSYAANHPGTRVVAGDVLDGRTRTELLAAARGVDLVAGGPPCQGFSTVGKKDENDPRNRLFRAFLEIVGELRPRAVLFENVSGFRRMYGGKAFAALEKGLGELGYGNVRWAILNAAQYGVPQTRERTFVAAFRGGEEFAFPEPARRPAQYLTLSDALSDLPRVGSGEAAGHYAGPPANGYQRRMREGAGEVLEGHEGPWHGERLKRVMACVPPGGSILDVPEELRPRSCFANTYARLRWDRPSTTVTRNFGTPSSSRCIHPQEDRGLTTREGARLQSFPDRYRFFGTRVQKNLQIGNAVPPLLAEAVGIAVMRALEGAKAQRERWGD